MRGLISLTAVIGFSAALPAADVPKEVNRLVGAWKGAGAPEGTPDERQKGHWSETVAVGWKFAKAESWLEFEFKTGKLFALAVLRPGKDGKTWTWTAVRPDKSQVAYSGVWDGKQFQLTRDVPDAKLAERLTVSPLHDNRFVYRLETKKADSTLWTKTFQVGHTKEGVSFAESGDGNRECVVTGGKGTTAVTFEGRTYYVCCSGCRDEFKDDPKKYVLAWEAKRKKKQ